MSSQQSTGFDPRAATTGQVASVFGVSPQAVQAWRRSIPTDAEVWREVQGRGRGARAIRWDVPALIAYRERQAAARTTEQGETPAERELRRKRAAEADLRELDLAERHRRLVDPSVFQGYLDRLARLLRETAQSLQRQFGNDAGQLLNEAIDDFEAELKRDRDEQG